VSDRDPGDKLQLPSRTEARALLAEYTQKPGLVKHALAVEAALKAYARKYGEPEEAWGLVGLLHDFDYERWPAAADHPFRGSEILAQRGYPEWVRRAAVRLPHGVRARHRGQVDPRGPGRFRAQEAEVQGVRGERQP
jgi:putative nucleotidyltransferase with HDIG domain